MLSRLHHDQPVSGQYGSVQRTSRRRKSLNADEDVLDTLAQAGIEPERVLGGDRDKVNDALDVTDLNEQAVYDIEETGDEDYQRVSSHDLRRCWANHLLVEEGISPRIVMALGGWSSYDAIEPSLAAPTEGNSPTS